MILWAMNLDMVKVLAQEFLKKQLGLLQGSYKSNIFITCCDEGMDTGLLLDLYGKTCS